jgi:hypothetical protein
VATEVDIDLPAILRNHYKKVINSGLIENTWGSEESWLKFWMFENGDYIPVDYSYMKTVATAIITAGDDYDLTANGTIANRSLIHDLLESEGRMLWGSVQPDNKSLNVAGYKKPSSAQLRVLRGFFIKYKLDSVYTQFEGGIGSFSKEVMLCSMVWMKLKNQSGLLYGKIMMTHDQRKIEHLQYLLRLSKKQTIKQWQVLCLMECLWNL